MNRRKKQISEATNLMTAFAATISLARVAVDPAWEPASFAKVKQRMVSVILLLALAAGLGCSTPTTAVTTRPIWAAFIYDISRSVIELPSLTPAQIDQLLRGVEHRGGTSGFLAFGSKPNVRLRRLELLPVSGLLNERAAKASANRRNAGDWREHLVTALQRPRDEKRTAFNCAMQSAKDFLQESISPPNAEKLLVIWSDGKDTAGVCASVTFPSDVRILVTGMSEERAASLRGARIERFEDSVGILKALVE